MKNEMKNKKKYSTATKTFIERLVEFKEENYAVRVDAMTDVSWGRGTFEDDLGVGIIDDAFFSIEIV